MVPSNQCEAAEVRIAQQQQPWKHTPVEASTIRRFNKAIALFAISKTHGCSFPGMLTKCKGPPCAHFMTSLINQEGVKMTQDHGQREQVHCARQGSGVWKCLGVIIRPRKTHSAYTD